MTKAEIDQDLARLEEQITALRADIASIVQSLGHLGQTGGETLRTTLAEKAEALRTNGEAHLADASHSAEAALADVTDYARRKPMHALAMAGGLGLLLGLLFGRR